MKRLTIALALSSSLILAGCGTDDTTGTGVSVSATDTVQTPTATETATEDATGTDDAAAETGAAAAPAPVDDLTSVALEAIGTAEAETGGTAYGVDDQDDDGTWQVDVRVGDRSVEVTVAADGTTVESTEDDDLDDDDRAGLDAATITLVEAIEIATREVGGVLEHAELDEEDGTYAWEVTVDGADGGDDVEVLVSVSGEVLRTDG